MKDLTRLGSRALYVAPKQVPSTVRGRKSDAEKWLAAKAAALKLTYKQNPQYVTTRRQNLCNVGTFYHGMHGDVCASGIAESSARL